MILTCASVLGNLRVDWSTGLVESDDPRMQEWADQHYDFARASAVSEYQNPAMFFMDMLRELIPGVEIEVDGEPVKAYDPFQRRYPKGHPQAGQWMPLGSRLEEIDDGRNSSISALGRGMRGFWGEGLRSDRNAGDAFEDFARSTHRGDGEVTNLVTSLIRPSLTHADGFREHGDFDRGLKDVLPVMGAMLSPLSIDDRANDDVVWSLDSAYHEVNDLFDSGIAMAPDFYTVASVNGFQKTFPADSARDLGRMYIDDEQVRTARRAQHTAIAKSFADWDQFIMDRPGVFATDDERDAVYGSLLSIGDMEATMVTEATTEARMPSASFDMAQGMGYVRKLTSKITDKFKGYISYFWKDAKGLVQFGIPNKFAESKKEIIDNNKTPRISFLGILNQKLAWMRHHGDQNYPVLVMQELAAQAINVSLPEHMQANLNEAVARRVKMNQTVPTWSDSKTGKYNDFVDWHQRPFEFEYDPSTDQYTYLQHADGATAQWMGTVYNRTQKALSGWSDVTVYRLAFTGKDAEVMQPDDTIKLNGPPLQSWTFDPIEALAEFTRYQKGLADEASILRKEYTGIDQDYEEKYSRNERRKILDGRVSPHKQVALVGMKVPVGRIFSTGYTGMGSVSQKEIVLFGSPRGYADEARVIDVVDINLATSPSWDRVDNEYDVNYLPPWEVKSTDDLSQKMSLSSSWDEAKHPRYPKGHPLAGKFAIKPFDEAVGSFEQVSPEQRLWQGKQIAADDKPSKSDVGKFGEGIAATVLGIIRGDQFGSLNVNVNNMPIDVVGDHWAVEVKTGLASNSKGAQKWRATIGQPAKTEQTELDHMSDAAKREHNIKKSKDILARKESMLRELCDYSGEKITAHTVCVIAAPDLKSADVFIVDGFHLILNWKQYATSDYYVGTFKTP